MKTYLASEKLINIFINNGFTDLTSEIRPDRYITDEKAFNLKTDKRFIGIDSKNYIYFDHETISPRHFKSCQGAEIKISLNENEIKSIVAFYRLPEKTRCQLKKRNQNITELYQKYVTIMENREWYKDLNSWLIEKVFQNIKFE